MYLYIDTSSTQIYVTLVPHAVNRELKINLDKSMELVKVSVFVHWFSQ